MEVTFDAAEAVGKLNELTKVQLPRASFNALNKALFETREAFKSQSKNIFTKTVPFTENSILYDKPQRSGDSLHARLFIRDQTTKGNAPANYLLPQIIGGEIYPTRFQRRLRARGFLGGSQGSYMRPIGDLPKGEYVRALWGISAFEDLRLSGKYGKRNYRTAGSYVFVPRNLFALAKSNISPELWNRVKMLQKANNGRIPSSGIYKVNKNSLDQKFQMLDNTPRVKRKFDFHAFAEDVVEDVFVKELRKNILR